MADFFSSLLDRSLQQSAVLRPRRLSRFEPLAAVGAKSDAALSDSVAEAPTVGRAFSPRDEWLPMRSSPEPHTPMVGQAASEIGEAETSQSTVDGRLFDELALIDNRLMKIDERIFAASKSLAALDAEPASPVRVSVSQGQAYFRVAEAAMEQPEILSRTARKEGDGANALPLQPRTHPATVRGHDPVVDRHEPRRERLWSKPEAAIKIRPASIAIAAHSPEPRRASKDDHSVQPVAATAEQPMLRPALAPLPRPPAPMIVARRDLSSPPPAPTVHVTICRVEIRATSAPPKAARAPQSATPRLSLDEYLKSRSGGAR